MQHWRSQFPKYNIAVKKHKWHGISSSPFHWPAVIINLSTIKLYTALTLQCRDGTTKPKSLRAGSFPRVMLSERLEACHWYAWRELKLLEHSLPDNIMCETRSACKAGNDSRDISASPHQDSCPDPIKVTLIQFMTCLAQWLIRQEVWFCKCICHSLLPDW